MQYIPDDCASFIHTFKMVAIWLKSKKLTLNVKKTKQMIIGRHFRLRHLDGDLKFTVNN